MADYADALTGRVYSPREYVEHQLHMTDEEKEMRRVFFDEQFTAFNKRKAERDSAKT